MLKDAKFEKMSDEQSKLLITCALAEGKELKMTDELPLLSQIVKKRIEALKLPIKFTDWGLMAINALVRVPGAAVALLIDALTMFENKEVTVSDLCELYPFGFYDEESFEKYIDDFLKPRKVKWAEIY